VLLKIHSTNHEWFQADVVTGYKERQTRTCAYQFNLFCGQVWGGWRFRTLNPDLLDFSTLGFRQLANCSGVLGL